MSNIEPSGFPILSGVVRGKRTKETINDIHSINEYKRLAIVDALESREEHVFNRAQLYTLAEKFISLAWAPLHAHIQKHRSAPDAGYLYEDGRPIGAEMISTLDEIESLDILVALLNRHTTTTARISVEKYMKTLNISPDELEYSQLLDKGCASMGRIEPANHLIAGFKTASNEMWRIIGMIPKVFTQEKRCPIPRNVFETVMKNGMKLVFTLAQSHVRFLTNYSGALRGRTISGEATDFMLTGSGAALSIDLKSELLKKIAAENFETDHDVYHGCPALRAKGPTGKSVIAEMYLDWIVPATEKFVAPRLQELHY